MRVSVIFSLIAICVIGCASQLERYIEAHPNLQPQKILAMRYHTVINGMSQHEVELTLGKPTFIEAQRKTLRWVYRNLSGVAATEAYSPSSSFPQGIGYIVPLFYQCREMRIDFDNGKVCRVEKILSF